MSWRPGLDSLLDSDFGFLLVGGALALSCYALWQWQPLVAVAFGAALGYLAAWGAWLVLGRGRRAGSGTKLGGLAMLLAALAFVALMTALEAGAIDAVTDFIFGS